MAISNTVATAQEEMMLANNVFVFDRDRFHGESLRGQSRLYTLMDSIKVVAVLPLGHPTRLAVFGVALATMALHEKNMVDDSSHVFFNVFRLGTYLFAPALSTFR